MARNTPATRFSLYKTALADTQSVCVSYGEAAFINRLLNSDCYHGRQLCQTDIRASWTQLQRFTYYSMDIGSELVTPLPVLRGLRQHIHGIATHRGVAHLPGPLWDSERPIVSGADAFGWRLDEIAGRGEGSARAHVGGAR